MGFENKIFADGDITFELPYWRKALEDIEKNNDSIDFIKKKNQSSKIKENEIAIRHPNNNSYNRINDSGSIEMFTEFGTGLRMNTDGTVQLFGDKLQLLGKEIEFISTANGVSVNGYVLGENVLQKFPKKKGLTKSYIEMVSELGINTNRLEEKK